MWEMLKKQGHGQEGDLLVNGYANIFYLEYANGELWAVYCRWGGYFDGWGVGADPVSYPGGWSDGCQVVSR